MTQNSNYKLQNVRELRKLYEKQADYLRESVDACRPKTLVLDPWQQLKYYEVVRNHLEIIEKQSMAVDKLSLRAEYLQIENEELRRANEILLEEMSRRTHKSD